MTKMLWAKCLKNKKGEVDYAVKHFCVIHLYSSMNRFLNYQTIMP